MSPIPIQTTWPHETRDELQQQNNTVQFVAAICTIAHSIPLLVALWLQWMTFTTTRNKAPRDCHHDRPTAVIEPTRVPSISLAGESSDPESPHTQNPNVQSGLEGQPRSNTTEIYRAPTVAQEQPSTDD